MKDTQVNCKKCPIAHNCYQHYYDVNSIGKHKWSKHAPTKICPLFQLSYKLLCEDEEKARNIKNKQGE